MVTYAMNTSNNHPPKLNTSQLHDHQVEQLASLATNYFWGLMRLPLDYCQTAAFATMMAASQLGIPALFAAGRLSWRTVPDELGDGGCATHFAYIWKLREPRSAGNSGGCMQLVEVPNEGFIRAFKPGMLRDVALPEVHCWVVLPFDGSVLDISTEGLVSESRLAGLKEWKSPPPPRYYCGPRQMDGGVSYDEATEATRLALSIGHTCLCLSNPSAAQSVIRHQMRTEALLASSFQGAGG